MTTDFSKAPRPWTTDPEVDAMLYRECTDDNTPFMRFWSAVNDQMQSRGKSELAYGEAKSRWNLAADEAWV